MKISLILLTREGANTTETAQKETAPSEQRKNKDKILFGGYPQQPIRPFPAQLEKNAVGASREREDQRHKDR